MPLSRPAPLPPSDVRRGLTPLTSTTAGITLTQLKRAFPPQTIAPAINDTSVLLDLTISRARQQLQEAGVLHCSASTVHSLGTAVRHEVCQGTRGESCWVALLFCVDENGVVSCGEFSPKP